MAREIGNICEATGMACCRTSIEIYGADETGWEDKRLVWLLVGLLEIIGHRGSAESGSLAWKLLYVEMGKIEGKGSILLG